MSEKDKEIKEVSSKDGSSFIATLVKSAIAYKITKSVAQSSFMKNTAIGKSSTLATAVSLGMGFLVTAMKENSSLVNAAVATATIGATVASKGKIQDFGEKYYKNLEEINKYVSAFRDVNYRFQEWGIESKQLYRERKNQTRTDVLKQGVSNFISHVVNDKGMNRSQAYSIIKNNSDGLLNSEFLTSSQYRKLANLPSHLQDYVNDYTSLNLKIGKTSLAATDGVGYFTDYKKNRFRTYGNIDASKVFSEGLNSDFDVYRADAENYVTSNPYLSKTKRKTQGFNAVDEYKTHLANTFKNKENEFIEAGYSSDESFEKTKEHFLNSDNHIMKALMLKQAKNGELTLGKFVNDYEQQIIKEVKDFSSNYLGNKTKEDVFSDSNFSILADKLDALKNGTNTALFHSNNAKKNSKEFLYDVMNDLDNNKEVKIFNNLTENKYDFFGNSRVHSKLVFRETNDGTRLIDKTLTDFKSIELGVMSAIESNLTPYFKALPLPGSFRRFNMFSVFKTKEKIVDHLDDTSINSFREANYNVNDSILSIKDTIHSLRALKDKVRDSDSQDFNFKSIVDDYNFSIKNSSDGLNENYGSDSYIKYKRKSVYFDLEANNTINGGYNTRTSAFERLSKIEKDAYNELSKLTDLKRNGYKGFDAYSTDGAAKSYHSYYVNLGDSPTLNKTLHNANNVVVVDGTSYYRTADFNGGKTNGSFSYDYQKADSNVIYSRNAFVKEIQSQRSGKALTNKTSGSGIYVSDEETLKHFDINEFLSSDDKIKYWGSSDMNLNPFSKRISINDEANLFGIFKKRWEEFSSTRKFAKESGIDIETDDLLLYGLGKNTRLKVASEIEKHEINTMFSKIMNSDDLVFSSLEDGSSAAQPYIKSFQKETDFIKKLRTDVNNDELDRIFGKETSNFIRNFNTDRFEMEITPSMSKHHSHAIVGNMQMISDVMNTKGAMEGYDDILKTFKENKIAQEVNKKDVFLSYVDESLYHFSNKSSLSDIELGTGTVEEIQRLTKKNAISKFFKLSGDADSFKDVVGEELLKDNTYINMEKLRHMDRIDYITDGEATLLKKSFTDLDAKDGFVKTAFKMYKEFADTSKFGNEASVRAFEIIESIENVFNAIGIRKLNFENKSSSAKYLNEFLKKRVYNIAATVALYSTVDGTTDVLVPDEVPFLGEGLTSAAGEVLAGSRFALQVAINTVGLGYVLRQMEESAPGLFSDNGILAPLDLSDTNSEMYGKLYRGDEVAVKKNRFWYTSGRNDFEGGEVETFRKHLLYSMRHRDSGIYENKIEQYFRKDLLPISIAWYLIDPYKEEKILASQGKAFPQREQLFTDIFLLGGVLSTTLGEALKPTLFIGEEKWGGPNGTILNPDYNPNDPTSSQYMNINRPNALERAFVPFYEDAINLAGMSGYMFDSIVKNVFFDPNTTNGTAEFDRLDKYTNSAKRYEDLQLGGLFGLTEGIRRIYSSNKLGTASVNPNENSAPSWLPQDYYKNFENNITGISIKESSLSGISEDSDFYTKLNALAINAPYSSEFGVLKKELTNRLSNGSMSEDEAYSAYKSLSYANAITGNDVVDKINLKADLDQTNVSVSSVTGVGEFIGGDGNRYKLAGISPHHDNPYSFESKANDLTQFMSELANSKNISAFVNQNKALSVKTDSQGEYIEIYAPEFDKYKSLKQNHYLRENVEGFNPLSSLIEGFSNTFKPYYLEKMYNNKDVASRFVDESLVTPQFKDWQDPINSYLMPYINLSSRGIEGFLSASWASQKVGNGSLVMPTINALSLIEGSLFGKNTSAHYYEEDLVANTVQFAKMTRGDDNFYEMRGNENFNTLKTFLSPTEKKYFQEIINTSDMEAREKIYSNASDRFKEVLENAWKQQADFVNSDFNFETTKQKSFDVADISFEGISMNDTLATAQIRNLALGKNHAYEKASMYKYTNTPAFSFDDNQSMLKKQGNWGRTKTMSTTFNSDIDHY